MSAKNIFLISCVILCISMFVSAIRMEIMDRRDHRRFMANMRRIKTNQARQQEV